MKRIALTLAALIVATSAQAQGVVNFSTRSGVSVNAPVTYCGGLADGSILGQLYASAPNEPLAPVGVPTPFRSDAGKGFITAGGNVVIPGVLPGGTAQIKMVAWASALGATYAAAVSKGVGGAGESGVITILTGGGILPPAPLAGLQGFDLAAGPPCFPEPSSLALGLVGGGLLLIRRKRGS
ncbi:MAG: PEP-CTERM sorting domain-containing protein [Verrucomicrobiales bacterium]|nr:PEP-CTERM sorting domain-containing protein [Verrucomicrobiales bacterium]